MMSKECATILCSRSHIITVISSSVYSEYFHCIRVLQEMRTFLDDLLFLLCLLRISKKTQMPLSVDSYRPFENLMCSATTQSRTGLAGYYVMILLSMIIMGFSVVDSLQTEWCFGFLSLCSFGEGRLEAATLLLITSIEFIVQRTTNTTIPLF